MPTEGKWLIIGMLCLAFAAAAFGWYWNLQASRHALDFWGGDVAQRIAAAPQAELLQLARLRTPAGADTSPADVLEVDGARYAVRKRADVSQVRGAGNVRRMLVQDASYQWPAEAIAGPDWTLALQVQDARGSAVVLLSPETRQAALLGHPGTVRLDPAAAKILSQFADEQFRR